MSQLDTPSRKVFTNGNNTSPLINASSGGGLGLSSLGRNFARSNLFRTSQPMSSSGSGAETEKPDQNSVDLSTPDRSNSTINNLVSDMNRQLREYSAELARSRELNQQIQQQMQSVVKRLDEVTAELHTSRTINQQLKSTMSSDNVSKHRVHVDEDLNKSIQQLNTLLADMRIDIKTMNSQIQNLDQRQSPVGAQMMEQHTALLLRGMQQQTQLQQESSAVAMATLNAAMMMHQNRAPMPPQVALNQPRPQIHPGQMLGFPVTGSPQSTGSVFSSPTQHILKQSPAQNLFCQFSGSVAAQPAAFSSTMSASGPKKQMLTQEANPPATAMPQFTVPANNIFSSVKSQPSPVKPLTGASVKPQLPFNTTVSQPAAVPVPKQEPKETAPKSTSDPIFDKFKPKEGSWTCNMCYVVNKPELNACAACQEAKPGAPKTAVQSAGKPSGGSVLANANISTPQFSFGASKPVTTSSTPSTGLFSFGKIGNSMVSAPTTGLDVGFKFGTSNITTAASPIKPAFGATGLVKTQVLADTPATSSKKQDSDNEEVEQCDEDKLYFKPVLEKLPDKIEVVTGEEGQNVLFEHAARLFRLRNGQWVERGCGIIKILEDEETKKARIVMRQDQTFKVCCNHGLIPEMNLTMLSTKNKDGTPASLEQSRAWTWWALDFAQPIEGETETTLDDNGGHKEIFALRFGNVQPSQEFYKVFTTSCKSTSPKKADPKETNQQEADEDEVQILDISNVSDEQKRRAEALKLPKEFYAYENGIKSGESDHMTEDEQKKEDELLAQAVKFGIKMPSQAEAENASPAASKPIVSAPDETQGKALFSTTSTKPGQTSAPSDGLFASLSKPSGIGLFDSIPKTTVSGGLFGQSTSCNNSSGGLFSLNAATTTSAGALFGKPTSSTASTGGLFGNVSPATTSAASTPPAASLFKSASPATNVTKSGVLFGFSTPTQSSDTTLFGSYTPTTTSVQEGSLFGASKAENTPASTTKGVLFETTTTVTSTIGGLFGSIASSTPSTANGGLFGSSLANASGQGLFSSLAANQNASLSQPLFGSEAGSKPVSSSLFNFATSNNTGSPISSDKNDSSEAGNVFTNAADNKGLKDFTQLNKSLEGDLTRPSWLNKTSESPSWATQKPLFSSQAAENNASGPVEDAEGHAIEDPNYDPQYQAIVSLPEVEVKTGEESEVVLFLSRVRAYKLQESEWKERGIGELKILVKPEHVPSGNNPREEWPAANDLNLGRVYSARVLMRREQVLKICLNQTISPKAPFIFKPVGGSKRVVCWKGTDYSSGEPETETFSLKFKNEQEYVRFSECLNRAMNLPRA